MRQLIIARKDLNMSAGKLAAQVSHASMAFISRMICDNAQPKMKYKTLPSFRIDMGTGEKTACFYMNYKLSRLAKAAFEKGEDHFTYRKVEPGEIEGCENEIESYVSEINIDKDVYEQWFSGIFTKTICEAKNRNQLMKAVSMAETLGLKENKDFFLIKDNSLTELEPEEVDENGVGRTLTCIGFRPLPDDIAHSISKKYQLFK